MELQDVVRQTAERIAEYRASVADRPVAGAVDLDVVRQRLGVVLGNEPAPADVVIERLAAAVEPALVGTTGPRYFGFVVGGALPAATCADLLATGWDQLAFNATTSPAAAVVEEVAGGWLKEVLGLPSEVSFGLVTGCQAANTVGLAAARHHVLSRAGWDVEAQGLRNAPPVRVLAGAERHATIDRSLRLLGFGSGVVEEVPADANGGMQTARLAEALDRGSPGPTIVCLQAGNVNTGACDDLAAGCEAAHRHQAWVHVDGAFGLWAAASPATRVLTNGVEKADSWATDGHKWLNVPYDSGYIFCAHPDSHAAAMSLTAAYLVGQANRAGGTRAPSDFVPESSRRARGFATWAALCELGRRGVAELVERCCARARQFADSLSRVDGVTVANAVVLNQVLVGFGDDERTDRVIAAVQRDGTCWMGGTTWRGKRLMRISVSNWTTTESDIDWSVAAIDRILKEER